MYNNEILYYGEGILQSVDIYSPVKLVAVDPYTG